MDIYGDKERKGFRKEMEKSIGVSVEKRGREREKVGGKTSLRSCACLACFASHAVPIIEVMRKYLVFVVKTMRTDCKAVKEI